MKVCELKVQDGNDRNSVVAALVRAGYKVSVEERKLGPFNHNGADYWVVVEEAGGEKS